MRTDGRTSRQIRPMRLTPHFIKHPHGSVLIELGDTRVLCTVNVEDGVPGWMRSQKASQGWLTAEYSMLPGATHLRTKRERGHISGRTQEIQRLIGRSLRGVINLKKCPDMTFLIDCDVLQADGGTRTAAITGSYVALRIAIDKLLQAKKLKQNPLHDGVAAISVGIKGGEILVDLNYEEDSQADSDMNVVMTHSGRILEIQGTAENASFAKDDVVKIIEAAEESLKHMTALQQQAYPGLF